MKQTLSILSVAIFAVGCAHEERPFAFAVPAPPSAVLEFAHAALVKEGQTVIPKSPTRIVTPWEDVGKESASMSTDGWEADTVIVRRRFAILVQPTAAGSSVTVREDYETCPLDMPKDRSRTATEACVRTDVVPGEDQQKIDRLGNDLQALLVSGSH